MRNGMCGAMPRYIRHCFILQLPPTPPCSPSLRHVDHPCHVDPAHRAGVQEDHQAAAGRVSLHVRICQLCPGGHHVDDVSFQINPISILMIIQISQGLILRQEGKIQESLEQFQVMGKVEIFQRYLSLP